MTTTETTNAQMDYPTTKDVLIKMIELDKADKLTGGDFDEMTYDAAGEWDEKFDGDINWCNAEAAEEDEVTLTDDEARDIIALADKLRAAMGGEDDAADEEPAAPDAGIDAPELDAEMEEEPGMRYDMMEEEEENLYEAALNNLDIDVVEEKEVQLENLKKQIYKKVVNRLLKESKK